MVPDDVPIHGIGHSNGALLHLLIGSLFQPMNSSNIVIAFNNRCAWPGCRHALDRMAVYHHASPAWTLWCELPQALTC